jgi:DNA-directed RNA polymerase specialized sigma24 family protein
MLFWKSSQEARDLSAEYATRRDFQQIFTEDMADLHLLAFLLTGDQDKAEECFVSGLDDSITGNPVFREWARSWSKRAIIKNAIKALAPAPGMPASVAVNSDRTTDQQHEALISAVTRLDPFDRFVFVMAVLERYSVHECSTLLDRPLADVVSAKSRALQRLGAVQSPVSSSRGTTWMSSLVPNQTA